MARYANHPENHQTKRTAAENSTNQTQSNQPFNISKRKLLIIVKILTGAGIGLVSLLNFQPWIELAKQIGKQLTNIPFLDSLVQIPFIGGWIEWIFVNIVAIIGIALWGITQLMEVLPGLVSNPSQNVKNYRWIAYGFETLICFLRFPPYVGGLPAIVEDFPTWDSSLIDWWLLILFLLTMFSFEAIFHLIRNIRANF